MSLLEQFEDIEPTKKILLVLGVIALALVAQGQGIIPDRRISPQEAIDIAGRVREKPSESAKVSVKLDESPPESLNVRGPVYVVTFDEGDRQVRYMVEQLGGEVVGGSEATP